MKSERLPWSKPNINIPGISEAYSQQLSLTADCVHLHFKTRHQAFRVSYVVSGSIFNVPLLLHRGTIAMCNPIYCSWNVFVKITNMQLVFA